MNKIFRVIYSKTLGRFVVASELAKGECKSSSGRQGAKERAAEADAAARPAFALAPLALALAVALFAQDATAAEIFQNNQSIGRASGTGNSFIGGKRVDAGFAAVKLYGADTGGGQGTTNQGGSSGSRSVLVGFNSSAGGSDSTAVGYGSNAKENQSVAVGSAVFALADQATALGNNSFVTKTGAIAAGSDDLGANAAIVTNAGEVVGRYLNCTGGTCTKDLFLQSSGYEDITNKHNVNRADDDVFAVYEGNQTKYYKLKRNHSNQPLWDASRNGDREKTYRYSQLLPKLVLDEYRKNRSSGKPFERRESNYAILRDAQKYGDAYAPTWAGGRGAIAIGPKSAATADASVAIGTMSYALGEGAAVLGSGSFAFGNYSQAIGSNTYVYSDNSVAVGSRSQALRSQGMAYGYRAISAGQGSLAIGSEVYADADLTFDTSVKPTRTGNNGDININALETSVTSVSAINPKTTLDVQSGIVRVLTKGESAHPNHADKWSKNSIVIGSRSASTGSNNIVIGRGAYGQNSNGLAIGSYSRSLADNAFAVGLASRASAVNAMVFGVGSQASAQNSSAIGNFTDASLENSTALGYQSKTDYKAEYLRKPGWAPRGAISSTTGTNTGVISVGYSGNERRIVNVAAGYRDTDAVNVSQLKSLEDRIDSRDFGDDAQVLRYFSVESASDRSANASGTLVEIALRQSRYEAYMRLREQQLILLARKNSGVNIDAEYQNELNTRVNDLKTKLGTTLNNNPLNVADATLVGTQTANYDYDSYLAKIEKAKADAEKLLTDGRIISAAEKQQLSEHNFNNRGAKGQNSIAIGYGAGTAANANQSIAVGFNAQIDDGAQYAIVIGKEAKTHKHSSQTLKPSSAVVIGDRAIGGGADTVTIGRKSETQGQNAIAIGNESHAQSNAIVIGSYARAETAEAGKDVNKSVVIGQSAKAHAELSVVIGRNARVGASKNNGFVTGGSAFGESAAVEGNNGTALGREAYVGTNEGGIAVGYKANATASNSVALGSYSVANTAAGGEGYKPNDTTYSALTGNVLTSTLGAVSVGNGSTQTRRITSLAAGKEDTDAVNVAQLKAMMLRFQGDDSSNGKIRLVEDKISIVSGNVNNDFQGNNLKTQAADGKLTIGLNKNLSQIDSIGKGNNDAKITFNNDSIALNSKKISGVTDGVAATDAVNKKQLDTKEDKLTKGNLSAAAGSYLSVTGSPNGAVIGSGVTLDLTQEAKAKLDKADNSVQQGGKLFTVVDSGNTEFNVNQGTKLTIKEGDIDANFKSANLKTKVENDGTLKIGFSNSPTFETVNTPAISNNGTTLNLAASGATLNKTLALTSGNFSEEKAVTGAKVKTALESLMGALGTGGSVADNGTVTAPKLSLHANTSGNGFTATANNQHANIATAVTKLDSAVYESKVTIAANGTDVSIQPNKGAAEKFTLSSNADEITVTGNDGANSITLGLNASLKDKINNAVQTSALDAKTFGLQGDDAGAVTAKLGNQLTLKGDAATNAATGNIKVVQDGNSGLKIQLGQNLTGVSSIASGTGNNAAKITLGSTANEINVNGATIKGATSGEILSTDTNLVTGAKVRDAIDNAKTTVELKDATNTYLTLESTPNSGHNAYKIGLSNEAKNALDKVKNNGKITFTGATSGSQDIELGQSFKFDGGSDISATVAADGTGNGKVTLALNKGTIDENKVVTGTTVKNYVDGIKSALENTITSSVDGVELRFSGDNTKDTDFANLTTKVNLKTKALKIEGNGDKASNNFITTNADADGVRISIDDSKFNTAVASAAGANAKLKYQATNPGGTQAIGDKQETALGTGLNFESTENITTTVAADGKVTHTLDDVLQSIKSIAGGSNNAAKIEFKDNHLLSSQDIYIGSTKDNANKLVKTSELAALENQTFTFKDGASGTFARKNSEAKSLTIKADDIPGTTGTANTHFGKNLKVALTTAQGNANEATYTIGLKDEVEFSKVTTGGVAMSADGINLGSQKISNLAKGTATGDAVNVSQLTALAEKLGGSAAVDSNGGVTGPTYNVQNSIQNTVGDALSALDNAIKTAANTANGAVSELFVGANSTETNTKLTLNNQNKRVDIVGSDNIVTAVDEANKAITVKLGKDLTGLDSITGSGGAKLTLSGADISVNDKKITGLANAALDANSTDAVTGKQLHATEEKLTALTTKVNTNTDNITKLTDTVNNHTTKISTLETKVGEGKLKFTGNTTTSTGNNAPAVELANDSLAIEGDGTLVKTKAEGQKLTIEIDNDKLTEKAKAAAQTAVKVKDGTNTTVATDTTSEPGSTIYKVNLNGNLTGITSIKGLENRTLTNSQNDYGKGDNQTRAATEGALKALSDTLSTTASGGLKFAGNTGTELTQALGTTVKVIGDLTNGEPQGFQSAQDNIVVKAAENQGLVVQLAKDLKNISSISNGTSTITLNGGKISIGGATEVDFGDASVKAKLAYRANTETADQAKKVDVADGLVFKGTDHVVTSVADGGVVNVKLADTAKAAIDKVANGGGITFKDNKQQPGSQKVALDGEFKFIGSDDITATVAADGTNATVSLGLNKITDIANNASSENVATTKAVKDYVDTQLSAQAGHFEFTVDDDNATDADKITVNQSNPKFSIKGDGNIKTKAKTTGGELEVQLNKDVNLTDAGSLKFGEDTADTNTKVTKDGVEVKNAEGKADVSATGLKLSNADGSKTAVEIKRDGDKGGVVTVKGENGADGIALNGKDKTATIGGVTINGGDTASVAGLKALEGTGATNKGKISFTDNSKDIGFNGGKLTGLADGLIADNSKEAITGKQLNTIASKVAEILGTTHNAGVIAAPTFKPINGNSVAPTTYKGAIDELTTALNGGLKFEGNDGAQNQVSRKLGETLKIIGDGTAPTSIASGNIKVSKKADADDTLEIGLSSELKGIDSIGKGAGADAAKISFTAGSGAGTHSATSPQISVNNAKVTNLANGDVANNSKDAVTGSQLHNALDSLTTALGGGSTVTDGKVSAPSFALPHAKKGETDTNATSVSGAITALDSALGNLQDNLANTKLSYKANNETAKQVSLGDGLVFKDGTNTKAEVETGGVVKFSLNDNITLTKNGSITIPAGTNTPTVKFDATGITITPAGAGKTPVKLTAAGLDNGGNLLNNVTSALSETTIDGETSGPGVPSVDPKGFFDGLKSAAEDNATKHSAVNVSDLYNAVNNLRNTGSGGFGLVADKEKLANPNENEVARAPLGGNIVIKGDGTNINTKVVELIGQNGTTPAVHGIEISFNNKLEIGKAGAGGEDGSLGINGKNGSSVVINGKDGSIGLTGPAGADGKPAPSIVIKPKDSAPGLDGTTTTRIVYETKAADGSTTKEEVATLNDGLKFTGNNSGTVVKRKLNSTLAIEGEASAGGTAPTTFASDNIVVEAKADDATDANNKLLIKLSDKLKNINSIESGEVADNTDGSSFKLDKEEGLTLVDNTAGENTKSVTNAEGTTITQTVDGFETKAEYKVDGATLKDEEGNEAELTGKGLEFSDSDNNPTVSIQADERSITIADKADSSKKAIVLDGANKTASIGGVTINGGDDAIVSGLKALEGTGAANKGKISFTDNSKDIGFNGGKLTNVADGGIGANSTDAVTGKQLNTIAKAVSDVLGANYDNAGGISAPTFSAINGATTAPTTYKGAIDQLTTALNGGFKFQGNDAADVVRTLGSTLKIVGDGTTAPTSIASGNIKVSKKADADDTLEIGLSSALSGINSIEKTNGAKIELGADKVTLKGANGTDKVALDGLKAGDGDDQAVTGKQLKDLLKAMGTTPADTNSPSDAEVGKVNSDGTFTAPTYALQAGADQTGATTGTPVTKTHNTVGDALKAIDDALANVKGSTINSLVVGVDTAHADATNKVDLDQTNNRVDILGKDNITTSVSTDKKGIEVKLNDNITLANGGSLSIAGATNGTAAFKLDKDGITITPAAQGGKTVKPVKLTAAGLDNGGNAINNVASVIDGVDLIGPNDSSVPINPNAYFEDLKRAATNADTKLSAVNVEDLHKTVTKLRDAETGGFALVDSDANVDTIEADKRAKAPLGGNIVVKGDGKNIKTKVVEVKAKNGNTPAVNGIEISFNSNLSIGRKLDTANNDQGEDGTVSIIGKHGAEVTIKGADGTITSKAADGTTVAINGKDGTIGAKGTDGKGVTINGKDGTIGLSGANGANGAAGTTINIGLKADGTAGVDGVDTASKPRIIYTHGTDIEEVATLNDGLKFTGNNATKIVKRKLNSTLTIQGEESDTPVGTVNPKTPNSFAKDNIVVVVDDENSPEKLIIKLSDKLKNITSISNGSNDQGAKIELGSTDKNVSFNGGKLTNIAGGEVSGTSNEAITGKQLHETNERVTTAENKITALETAVGDGNFNFEGDEGGSRFIGLVDTFKVTGANGVKTKTTERGIEVSVDTAKISENVNLTYRENSAEDTDTTKVKTVDLKKGLNFVNGDNTTAAVEADGKVKFSLNNSLSNIDSIASAPVTGKAGEAEKSFKLSKEEGLTLVDKDENNAEVVSKTTASGTSIESGDKSATYDIDGVEVDDGEGNVAGLDTEGLSVTNKAGDKADVNADGVSVSDADGNNASLTSTTVVLGKGADESIKLDGANKTATIGGITIDGKNNRISGLGSALDLGRYGAADGAATSAKFDASVTDANAKNGIAAAKAAAAKLYALDGENLDRAITAGDLQAVAISGLTFKGNHATNEVHRKLSDTLVIKGEGSLSDSATTASGNIRVDVSNNDLVIKLADTLKNIASLSNGTNGTGAMTTITLGKDSNNVDFNGATLANVASTIDGMNVANPATTGKPTFAEKLAEAAKDAEKQKGVVNVKDLSDAVDSLKDSETGGFGLIADDSTDLNNLDAKKVAKAGLGENIQIVGDDKNISTSVVDKNGRKVVKIAFNSELEIGKADENGAGGSDGKLGINGKDGSSVVINGKDGSIGASGPAGADGKPGASVVINGKDGSIGLTGPRGADGSDGASVTIKPAKDGKPGLDGADGTTTTRIVYETKAADGSTTKEEVATLNDGLKFTGNNSGTVVKRKLNSTLAIEGEASAGGTAPTTFASDNIVVEAKADDATDANNKLLIKLSDKLKNINSIESGEVADNTDGSSFKLDKENGLTLTEKTADGARTEAVSTADGTTITREDETGAESTATYDIDGVNVAGADGKEVSLNTDGLSVEDENGNEASLGSTDLVFSDDTGKPTVAVDADARKITIADKADPTATAIELDGANKTATIGGITINGGDDAIVSGLKALQGTGNTAGKISFVDNSKNIGFNGGKLTDIADGEVSGTSNEAITGKQLHATNERVTTAENKITALETAVGDGNFNFEGDEGGSRFIGLIDTFKVTGANGVKTKTTERGIEVSVDTAKVGEHVNLTYRANSAKDVDASSVDLKKGLNFVNGDNTTAEVEADGKVKFGLNKDINLDSVTTSKTEIADPAKPNDKVEKSTKQTAEGVTVTKSTTKDGVKETDEANYNADGLTVSKTDKDGATVTTKVDANGIENNKELVIKGGNTSITVNNDGVNLNNHRLTGLADAENDGDAVNKKQLDTVETKLTEKITELEGKSLDSVLIGADPSGKSTGNDVINITKDSKNNRFDIVGKDGNIKTSVNGSKVEIALNPKLANVEEVKFKDGQDGEKVTVDGTGITVVGKDGTNADGTVAKGTTSTLGKDGLSIKQNGTDGKEVTITVGDKGGVITGLADHKPSDSDYGKGDNAGRAATESAVREVSDKLDLQSDASPFKYVNAKGEALVKGKDGRFYKPDSLTGKTWKEDAALPSGGSYADNKGVGAKAEILDESGVQVSAKTDNSRVGNVAAATESFKADPEFKTMVVNGKVYDARDVKMTHTVDDSADVLVKVGDKFYHAADLTFKDGQVVPKEGKDDNDVKKTIVVNGKVYDRADVTTTGVDLAGAEELVKVGDGDTAKYYRKSDMKGSVPKANVTAVNDSRAYDGLADLNSANEKDVVTVDDAKRMGFVVATRNEDPESTAGTYAEKVQNANKLEVVGGNNIEVTGATKGNTREIKVAMVKDPNFESVQLTHMVTDENGKVVGERKGTKLSTNADGNLYLSRPVYNDDGTIAKDDRGNVIHAPVVISGVAPGRVEAGSTDAVNGDQVYRLATGINAQLQQTTQRLNSGIAGAYAMANLIPSNLPGERNVSVAGGYYKGSNAVAIGFSATSDNGRLTIRASGTHNSSGELGAGVGAAYRW